MQLSFCRKAPNAVGPLVVGILTLASPLFVSPVQAQGGGHWVVRVKWTGTDSATFGSEAPGGSSDTFSFDLATGQITDEADDVGSDAWAEEIGGGQGESNANGASAGFFVDSYSMGATASATSAGQWQFTWEWKPLTPGNDPGPAPDEKLSVLISGSAEAGGGEGGGDFSMATGSASVGEASGERDPGGIWRANLSKQLFSTRSNGQTQVEGPKLSFNATASIPGGRTDSYGTPRFGMAGAGVAIGWQHDTRSVSLSRAGAHDERFDGNVTHGDTTYSHFVMTLNGAEPHENIQHFTTAFGGNWTERQFPYNDLQWTAKGTENIWSPASDINKHQDSWQSASYAIPFGSMKEWAWGWDGSPTGQTEKQITYTVKDNRNNEGEISAEAKYVLHIHDPVEISSETSERVTVNVILRRADGTPISTPNQPGGVPAGSVTVEQSNSSSSGYAVGASFDVTKFIKFLNLDFQYSVQNEVTTTTTASLTEDVPEGKYCYALVTHGYERVHQYLYKYDAGGRNVRMGRGAMDGNEDPSQLKEVPHEAFADKFHDVSTPFWSFPIWGGDLPPTPDPLEPYDSTYTS